MWVVKAKVVFSLVSPSVMVVFLVVFTGFQDESSESLHWCRTVVVLDTVVVVVDSLELELDEEYPDDDFGDGVGALYGEGGKVRSTVRKMS